MGKRNSSLSMIPFSDMINYWLLRMNMHTMFTIVTLMDFMKRRPAIVKPDEPFDMYELSAKELTDEPDNNSTKRKEI